MKFALRPVVSALPLLAILPAMLAGCPKGSTESSGATPSAKGAGQVVGVDNDGGPAPSNSGGSGSGGGRKHHGDKEAKEADGGSAPIAAADGGAGAPPMKLVINKPTPEPMPPPPVRKANTLPALPNLPARDKYPKEAKLPKPTPTGSCGQVWTGTEYIGVDCVSPDAHNKHPRLAKVVIPYSRIRQPADKLPKMVDHRLEGTEGIVRAQSGIECTAFAFTAALDHAYARWTGTPGEFSVMQVWARYHKTNEAVAAATNVGDLLSPESDWPYDKAVSEAMTDCPKDPAARKKAGPCGKPPDEEKLKALEKHALAEVTQIEVINSPEVELLREKLAAGQDATIGLKLHSFATAGDPGAKYIIGQSPEKGDKETLKSHEVLLAGYAMTPNGTYYLVHNSWGPRWGDGGFAWIHEEILKQGWINGSMEIPDVEPTGAAVHRAHRHGGFAMKCEGGKLPDSISGLCAGKCADGGPRHNNVCPDDKKNECPAGHINLTGECVLSAPKSAGTEGKVKWECAATGCTYEVPKGELECKEKECQISCPAPDFRLATTPKGLVCVE
jgi:hypothetical protein